MLRRRFCVVRARFAAASKVERTTFEMFKTEKAASQHAGAFVVDLDELVSVHVREEEAASQIEPHMVLLTSTGVYHLFAELRGLHEWKARLTENTGPPPGTSVAVAVAALSSPPATIVHAGAPPCFLLAPPCARAPHARERG